MTDQNRTPAEPSAPALSVVAGSDFNPDGPIDFEAVYRLSKWSGGVQPIKTPDFPCWFWSPQYGWKFATEPWTMDGVKYRSFTHWVKIPPCADVIGGKSKNIGYRHLNPNT